MPPARSARTGAVALALVVGMAGGCGAPPEAGTSTTRPAPSRTASPTTGAVHVYGAVGNSEWTVDLEPGGDGRHPCFRAGWKANGPAAPHCLDSPPLTLLPFDEMGSSTSSADPRWILHYGLTGPGLETLAVDSRPVVLEGPVFVAITPADTPIGIVSYRYRGQDFSCSRPVTETSAPPPTGPDGQPMTVPEGMRYPVQPC